MTRQKINGENQRVFRFWISKREFPKLSNEEVMRITSKLGMALEFDTFVNPNIASSKAISEITSIDEIPPEFVGFKEITNIDSIWSKEVPPLYFFKICDNYGLSDVFEMFYKMRALDVRFVLIGYENQREQFEELLRERPYLMIKERYHFWSHFELLQFYRTATEFVKQKKKFLT
ncbi:MAG: hypothetical protein GF411_09170 [Candidatus Lokiarchaeota archaeon]|nr:hypothetical protein [Candidatus Lokiarchaeota archaeon]